MVHALVSGHCDSTMHLASETSCIRGEDRVFGIHRMHSDRRVCIPGMRSLDVPSRIPGPHLDFGAGAEHGVEEVDLQAVRSVLAHHRPVPCLLPARVYDRVVAD